MSEDELGDAGGLVGHPENADEPGIPDSGGESLGGDDSSAAQGALASPLLSGCSFCGAPYECLTPGPTCVFARKFAPEPIVPMSVSSDITESQLDLTSDGVWVTYDYGYCEPRGDVLDFVVVHPDELLALRHAVTRHAEVRFLKWGEEL